MKTTNNLSTFKNVEELIQLV